MLSAKDIFDEIRRSDAAYGLLLSAAAKGEHQGGWENLRIAELTPDSTLAAKIRRHGEDESKHGRLFTSLLRRRQLEPQTIPDDLDYCGRLEREGIGLTHERLEDSTPLDDEEILRYLVHSRVTEQRAAEEIDQFVRVFGEDPDIGPVVRMIADDEVNHLSYCHEELARFVANGHAARIRAMLRRYALAEIRIYRDVSRAFVARMGELLSWSRAKERLLRLGVEASYGWERSATWRRMVSLAPPARPGAMG